MEYKTNKITRNTSYFTGALVIQKIISFVYFSYIAVKLGAGSLGNYTFALFFTTILAVFVDIGISNVLVREVAKFKEKSQKYFSAALAIKIPLAIIIYLLAVILINLLEDNLLVRQLVYIAGIVMVLDSFTLTFYALLRGHQNLKIESLGTILFQIILAISGFIIVNITNDLRILILALLTASTFNFIYSGLLIKIKLKLKYFHKSRKKIIKKILIISLPFALAGIFTRVYGYIDTILLKQLIDETAVGYYSLPYKITFSLQFIPMAFVASLYPAFSSYFLKSNELLSKIFHKSVIYLSMIGIPITFGILALAKPLILKVYTEEYEPSILPLKILMIALFFLFINFPLGSLLNACNRQIRNTIHIGIVMIINICLNVVLIPKFSYLGAAYASTISTIIMFGLQFYVSGQIIKLNIRYLFINFLKILAASLIMYYLLIYLLSYMNFIILIPLGGLTYILLLFLFKMISKEEVQILYQSIVKKEYGEN
ncbi:flippase [bacterium]|jgi:O-antigen/teichoic acid export membrane protein|nr:flippase [bacterium]MBT4122288.1 flippase [bacterium]MBT4335522.1 flippase [bacterium]MBT4495745.1 flippase [bacterium]MBT4764143.1 flippase [bacterium]